jgi:hypothetical protein
VAAPIVKKVVAAPIVHAGLSYYHWESTDLYVKIVFIRLSLGHVVLEKWAFPQNSVLFSSQ